MGKFDELLRGLARDPAMVFYLDNCMSHKGSINENWGRELLELFAMGVGMDGEANYSEDDVKEAARAFTGWTITNAIPRYPYGRYESNFIYNRYDHDEDEKTFLGETGNFNGDDIVNIICKQPSAARFVARHLYNFFVADDVEVPAWQRTPPRDPEAIKMLEDEYFSSGYDVGAMLKVLLNSDFLQERPLREGEEPHRGGHRHHAAGQGLHVPQGWACMPLANNIRYMGQDLMNPPPLKAGTPAREWIDSGTWWSASTSPPTRWATPACPASRTSSTGWLREHQRTLGPGQPLPGNAGRLSVGRRDPTST